MRRTVLSKAVKHYWYGETSPWTEQQPEDMYFKDLQSRPAKVVILDREHPPQPRSAQSVESEDWV
jgi:hypothetical protein